MIRYISYVALWIAATVVGAVVYPLLKKDFTFKLPHGKGVFKSTLAAGVWGNRMDGLTGDKPYRDNEAKAWFRKLWPSYFWTCIRNPANNLARSSLAASGIVTSITKIGNMTYVTFRDNPVKYWFYYTPNNRITFKFGWKLFPDMIKVGEFFNGKLALSVQKSK